MDAPRGLRRQVRCAWCRVAGRHPDLLEEIHVRHLERGLGCRVLALFARRELAAVDEKVPSARSLSRHLRHHVDRAHFAIGEALEPVGAGRRGVEFDELWVIQKRLTRQLDVLEKAIAYTKDDGTDLHRLSVFAGLTNSSRSTLEAIARMRGSEGTTIATAQKAISEALREFAGSLADELTGVADLAEGAPGAEEVAERLRAAVAQVGQLAVSAAQTAMARTCAWANVHDPEIRTARPPRLVSRS